MIKDMYSQRYLAGMHEHGCPDIEKDEVRVTSSSRSFSFSVVVSYVILIASLMHLLRNVSQLYYLIYVSIALCSIASSFFVNNLKSKKFTRIITPLFLFLYATLLSVINSSEYGDPTIGLVRAFFIFPVIFALWANMNEYNFRAYITIWSIFILVSALSILLQFIVGPIAWFSESFERAGITRFGSLAGSLTVFGNVVGAAFFAMSIIKSTRRWIVPISIIFLISAIASLQKASIASLIIALVLVFIAKGMDRRYLVAVSSVAIIALVSIPFLDRSIMESVLQLFENFVGTIDSNRASDVSVGQSAIDRFTELPSIAIEYFRMNGIIFGVGVFGGSGGLGYPDIPHSHNLLVETTLILGIIPALAIFAYLIFVLTQAFRILVSGGDGNPDDLVIASGALICLIIPSIFAGAIFYHPVLGSLFWMCVFYLHSRGFGRKEGNNNLFFR